MNTLGTSKATPAWQRKPLFSCSPAMAAKLARCEAMAREQRLASNSVPSGGELTADDFKILYGMSRMIPPRSWGYREVRRAYMRNLNA